MSTDTTEAATGAAPPAWPTGISGTNHSNKPTEKRGANSGNSQQPQQIEAATHSPGNTSPTPPAAEAQPPVAESSAAANPAPKTADAAAVAAAGVVAQYSAENVFKYTSGKSGALSLEKLQEMTLQERAKYAADMMQQQQQQQIIATLRAKATSIESCNKLAMQINDNIAKMNTEVNISSTLPGRKIELRKRKGMFQMALQFLLEQHNKLKAAAVLGNAAIGGGVAAGAAGAAASTGGGIGTAVPASARGSAAASDTVGATITATGEGGGGAGMSKVALEGAQAHAIQQDAANQLAATAANAGTLQGFDTGPGARTSSMMKTLDMTQQPPKAENKRTHDEMCRWLEKRKRAKVLKAKDHDLASATVFAETEPWTEPVEKEVLLEQLLSYHVHTAAPSTPQNVEQGRICELLVESSEKLKDRFHKVLERQPEIEHAAELIVLGREWNTAELQQLNMYKQRTRQVLINEEETLRNPPEQVPMQFDLSFAM